MTLVPVLFVATIVLTAVVGDLVARSFSDPMNRRLRKHGRFGQTLDVSSL
jgi:hypothetical protein